MRILAAFALSLALIGCETPTPTQHVTADPRRYTELVPGLSTESDAEFILGTAKRTNNLQNGQTLLLWDDIDREPSIHLAILFGPDHRMIHVESVTTLP